MSILFLLPIFFMYIFPVILLLNEDPVYTKPWIATSILILGLILIILRQLKIIKIIRQPRRLKRQHQQVQQKGRPVEAQVLSSRTFSTEGAYPDIIVELEFYNLTGHKVKALLRTQDSKPHEERFHVGKTINLMLNQDGQQPVFTVAGAEYETRSRFYLWFFLLFDLAYAVGLFLFSYQLHNNGFGWRFLSPFHPWLHSAVMGLVFLHLANRMLGLNHDPTQMFAYDFLSAKESKEINQILLYGRSTVGEVLSYQRTGTYVNEQPEIRFRIQYENEYGDFVKASHKQVIDLLELNELKTDLIEVVYLPGQKNLYMFNYL